MNNEKTLEEKVRAGDAGTSKGSEPASERMNPTLPPNKPFRQFCRHEDGWTDHYGALHVAAAYAGLVMPARYAVRGLWQHGCHGPWQMASPGVLVVNAPGAQARPAFVARQEEADLLRANGYPQVRAIGLPIVYTPPPQVERVAGSLLVVPTHTLIGDKFPDRVHFERYADEVREIAGQFRHVVVCVHPNCRKNGLWVKEFTERGFEIVYGAQTDDANALLRVRTLFSQFETLTTNGWGSHVAYALAFGLRVSITGTEPARKEADLLRDATWAADKEALKRVLSEETRAAKHEFLKAFHVPAIAAISDVALGRWFVGADNRLPPEEMRTVLKQLIDPAPCTAEEAAHAEAQLDKPWKSKLTAGLAFASRDRTKAVKLMLEGLQAAQTSNNPTVILNALIEIPAQLGRLDAGRARYLLELALPLADQLQRRDARVRATELLASLPR